VSTADGCDPKLAALLTYKPLVLSHTVAAAHIRSVVFIVWTMPSASLTALVAAAVCSYCNGDDVHSVRFEHSLLVISVIPVEIYWLAKQILAETHSLFEVEFGTADSN